MSKLKKTVLFTFKDQSKGMKLCNIFLRCFCRLEKSEVFKK